MLIKWDEKYSLGIGKRLHNAFSHNSLILRLLFLLALVITSGSSRKSNYRYKDDFFYEDGETWKTFSVRLDGE